MYDRLLLRLFCFLFVVVVVFVGDGVEAGAVTEDSLGTTAEGGSEEDGRYRLEGKVVNQHTTENNKEWTTNARVIVDGGQYIGILKSDGSFAVNGVPSGSYIVEVIHPKFAFEGIRVDVNSKGKIRARALNFIQPSTVNALTYPLKIRSRGKPQYFQQRDQWRVSDFIFSPMVMMMVMPLLLVYVMPKLLNSQDPETQKEMQKSMNILNPKSTMPDMSEWLTQMFKGGAAPATQKSSKTSKSSRKKD